MIVFTAFWIFDAQMQIEASVSLTLNRNVRITLGPDGAPPQIDLEGDDDDDLADDDDDELFSIASYSDNSSIFNDSIFADDIEILEEEGISIPSITL